MKRPSWSSAGVVLGSAVLGLIPLNWLGSGAMINGIDTNYPLRASVFVTLRRSAWNWTLGPGSSNLPNLGTVTWSYLALWFERLAGSAVLGQRVMLVLFFAAVPLSFSYLLRVLEGRWRAAHLAGSIIYLFNPFFMSAWSNVLVSTIAAAIAIPLMLALALRILPRAATPGTRLFVAWGASSLLTSLISQGPQLLLISAVLIGVGTIVIARTIVWKRVAGLVGIAVVVNAFWLVPQLAFAASTPGVVSTESLQALGQLDWSTKISEHTSLLNVQRMTASWDWFERWGDVPFVPYAARYLHNPFLVALGLAVPAAAFAVLLVHRTPTTKFFAVIALLGVAFGAGKHPPLGFLFTWASDHVPLFGIYRSPWYKFALPTVMGYGLLIGIGASRVADWMHRRQTSTNRIARTRAVPVLATLCIAAMLGVYGAPLITGEILAPGRRYPPGFEVRVPSYVEATGRWLDRVEPGARVLWLPRRTEIYDWGMLGVVPLLYNVSLASFISDDPLDIFLTVDRRVMTRLFDAFDDQDVDRGLSIAGLYGVRFVVVRDDVDESFYYPAKTDAAALNVMLAASSAVRRVKTFGPWTVYELPHAKRFVTTSRATTVPGSWENLLEVVNVFAPGTTTFVDDSAGLSTADAAAFGDGETIMTVPFSPDYALVRPTTSEHFVAVEESGSGQWLRIVRETRRTRVGTARVTIPGATAARIRLPSSSGEPAAFAIDAGEPRPIGQSVHLRAGNHKVLLFERLPGNLVDDGSFESSLGSGATEPGPSALRLDSASFRTATRTADRTHGSSAVELTARGGSAAVRRTIDSADAEADYLVTFDYRTTGGLAGIAVTSGARVIRERQLASAEAWRRGALVVRIPARLHEVTLSLRAHSTTARFDNVRVERIKRREGEPIPFSVAQTPAQGVELRTTAGPLARSMEGSEGAVEHEESFEGSPDVAVFDGGERPGKVRVVGGLRTAQAVADGRHGASALEITSTGNRSAVAVRFDTVEAAAPYRIGFDVKHIAGSPAVYSVRAGRQVLKEGVVSATPSWSRHEIIVESPADGTAMELWLMSESGGERTVNRFDRVAMHRLKGVDEVLVGTGSAPASPGPPVSVERVSGVHYRIIVPAAERDYLLGFLENFDPGWAAKSDAVEIGKHVRTNGYGNGWVVRPNGKGGVIDVRYGPQRWIHLGVGVTLAGTIALLLLAVVGFRRGRRGE